MVWLIVSLLVIVASGVLAVWRYIQTSTNLTHIQAPPAIYIVKNRQILTPELISSLVSTLAANNLSLAFEILKRNQDQVLIMVIPRWILAQHPEIQTIEIEDYLPPVEPVIQDVMCLQFADPKNKLLSADMISQLFNQLSLSNNEGIFIQLIARPYNFRASDLDANVRVVITAANRGRSQQLVQQFIDLLSRSTNLVQNPKEQNSAEILENYRARQYVRHESIRCALTPTDIDYFLI